MVNSDIMNVIYNEEDLLLRKLFGNQNVPDKQ